MCWVCMIPEAPQEIASNVNNLVNSITGPFCWDGPVFLSSGYIAIRKIRATHKSKMRRKQAAPRR